MRIITGKARGIRLETLEGLETRPTSERSKEAIFSMLQFNIAGSEVLDLFAGSAQMGLEALSRGAIRAHLIDKSRGAYEVIKRNISKTRLEHGAVALCEDSILFLKRQDGNIKFDIVFIDPPYASSLIDEALRVLYSKKLVESTSFVICESDRFDIMSEENSKHFEVVKTMKHGVAHISVLRARFLEEV